jgi:hypothetical protein
VTAKRDASRQSGDYIHCVLPLGDAVCNNGTRGPDTFISPCNVLRVKNNLGHNSRQVMVNESLHVKSDEATDSRREYASIKH